jgi:hypothetical protein
MLKPEEPPESHPLDFDWRFAEPSVRALASLCEARTLALGCPGIARRLETTGAPVVLIDRQPLQPVHHRLAIDVQQEAPDSDLLGTFATVVADPPWYPDVYARWLTWAAACLSPGGRILVSLWPEDTRPNAVAERDRFFCWLDSWARVDLEYGALEYLTPPFEREADRVVAGGMGPKPLRKGDLVILRPFQIPPLLPPTPALSQWYRLVLDDYQLALRIQPVQRDVPRIYRHPQGCAWSWPSVSRRHPGRDKIGLWSSHNEVALVSGNEGLRALLHNFAFLDGGDRRRLRDAFAPLADWQLPAAPIRRVIEWIHHG